MKRKKLAFNNVKSFLNDLKEIPIEEQVENYKAAYGNKELEIRIKNAPKVISKISRTHLDETIRKAKE
jgi:hypothetical protein